MLVTDLLADIPPEPALSGSSFPIVLVAVAVVAAALIAVGVIRRRRSRNSASPDTDR